MMERKHWEMLIPLKKGFFILGTVLVVLATVFAHPQYPLIASVLFSLGLSLDVLGVFLTEKSVGYAKKDIGKTQEEIQETKSEIDETWSEIEDLKEEILDPYDTSFESIQKRVRKLEEIHEKGYF